MFDVSRIGKTSAKFDRDKLLAFNTDACAAAAGDRLLTAFKDYITLNETPFGGCDDAMLVRLLEVSRGFRTYADIVGKTGFMFLPDEQIVYDDKAVQKNLTRSDNAGLAVLEAILPELATIEPWTVATIDGWLTAYGQARDLKLGQIAQPIRVAVAGVAVSPAIGETLAMMGRDAVVRRIRKTIQRFGRSSSF